MCARTRINEIKKRDKLTYAGLSRPFCLVVIEIILVILLTKI